jgi:DNA polymerase III subunit epsilon
MTAQLAAISDEQPVDSYLIVDTETSGLPPPWKKGNPPIPADDPRQPRMAELFMILANPQLEVEQEFQGYIKPDGWTMSAGATNVNGLTDEFLAEHGIPVVDALIAYTQCVLQGRVVVCHNAQFDTKILRGELRRAQMSDLFELTRNICTKDSLKGVVGNHWQGPKLSVACDHFGVVLTDAHHARNDAYGCLGVLRAMRIAGMMPEPRIIYSKYHENGDTAPTE